MANGPTPQLAANPRFHGAVSPGIAKLIGFRLMAFGGGEATVELSSGPQHYNPMGTVHGGVLCAARTAEQAAQLPKFVSF